MKELMEKLNKLSLPATILLASIILGGFYYLSEINKQRSLERQQQVRIEQERQDQLTKELQEQQTKEETGLSLNACLSLAEAEAQRLNQGLIDYGKTAESKGYNLSGAFDDVSDQLEKDKAECFKKYPQK